MMGTEQVFKSLVYDPAIMQLKLSGSQLQTFRLHRDFLASLPRRTLLHGLRVFVHEL